MVKKIRTKAGKAASMERNVKLPRLPARPVLDEGRAADVKYFLRTLNQISLALDALGYSAEGQALAQVKFDLQDRIFWTSKSRIVPPVTLQ